MKNAKYYNAAIGNVRKTPISPGEKSPIVTKLGCLSLIQLVRQLIYEADK